MGQDDRRGALTTNRADIAIKERLVNLDLTSDRMVDAIRSTLVAAAWAENTGSVAPAEDASASV